MPTLKGCTFGSNVWFGFFEGESEGYNFRTCATMELEANVQSLLKAKDTTIRAIAFGQNTWFVHSENVDATKLSNREYIISKDFDEFTAQVDAKLAEAKSLRVVQYGDGHYIAYFEGSVSSSCTWSTVVSNEELVTELGDQLTNGMSLKSICYGDGAWFLYFDGNLEGDAQWVVEDSFEAFAKNVSDRYDTESALRAVAFGNNSWVGFWEGKLAKDQPSAWGARSKVLEFVDHIQELWEEDEGADEDGGSDSGAEETRAPKQPSTGAELRKAAKAGLIKPGGKLPTANDLARKASKKAQSVANGIDSAADSPKLGGGAGTKPKSEGDLKRKASKKGVSVAELLMEDHDGGAGGAGPALPFCGASRMDDATLASVVAARHSSASAVSRASVEVALPMPASSGPPALPPARSASVSAPASAVTAVKLEDTVLSPKEMKENEKKMAAAAKVQAKEDEKRAKDDAKKASEAAKQAAKQAAEDAKAAAKKAAEDAKNAVKEAKEAEKRAKEAVKLAAKAK